MKYCKSILLMFVMTLTLASGVSFAGDPPVNKDPITITIDLDFENTNRVNAINLIETGGAYLEYSKNSVIEDGFLTTLETYIIIEDENRGLCILDNGDGDGIWQNRSIELYKNQTG